MRDKVKPIRYAYRSKATGALRHWRFFSTVDSKLRRKLRVCMPITRGREINKPDWTKSTISLSRVDLKLHVSEFQM